MTDWLSADGGQKDARCKGDSLREADPSRRGVVIFDFDGTLADSMPAIVRTAEQALREWGLPEERMADVPQLVGPPFPQAFSMVFGMDADDAMRVTTRYRLIYNTLGLDAWPSFPGIPELLDELRASGRRLAVASSKRVELLRRGLSDEGIAQKFDVVAGKTSDAEQTKATAIRGVLKDLGATPGDAVMVGDRFYDVDAARACGVPCVGVLYGRTAPREELEGAGACAVAESVDELGRVLLGR